MTNTLKIGANSTNNPLPKSWIPYLLAKKKKFRFLIYTNSKKEKRKKILYLKYCNRIWKQNNHSDI